PNPILHSFPTRRSSDLNSRSCFLVIDLYIPLEAPLRDDFERLPRLAARAAPAAICCFLDFAGIQKVRAANRKRIHPSSGGFAKSDRKSTRLNSSHDQIS